MRYFSLFSGIGGFENGFPNEWECIGYSETNRYAAAIYRYHFPEHRNYGDATRIISAQLPKFDMLVSGFPCQPFSSAGQRQGFEDNRGTLFFEIARILRDKRPRYLLLENVKGLLSSDTGKTFQTILGVLSNLGYWIQWQVLNSKDFGVPQNRERMFLVGHLGEGTGPKIFPLQNCTREVSASAKSNGRLRLTAKIIQRPQGKFKGGKLLNLAPTLRAASQSNTAVVQPALYHDGGREWEARADGISHAIKGGEGGYSKVHIVSKGQYQQDRIYHPKGLMCQISAGTHGNGGHLLKILDKTRIRRLTPLECERLQGFPDHFTQYGINEQGGRVDISDTQRYKVLGNAVTVNVIRAIVEKFRTD